jgi:mannose-1-phosphate guanylyltransferase
VREPEPPGPASNDAMPTFAARRWALVLAGGDGTRLQSLTRMISGAPIPKQYCRIAGERSLLEATLARVGPLVGPARTLVLVNENHLPLALPQLARVPETNVLVQPRNHDTGPGMLLGLQSLAARDADATVAVFPSDHHVRNEAAFRRHVAHMCRLVEDRYPERVALLGVRPDRPDSELGYIAPGAQLTRCARAFEVAAFHEKPARSVAAEVIRHGGLWNSFVMVARVGQLLSLLREMLPADVARLEPLPSGRAALARCYDDLEPWNFSRDFLARIPGHLLVTRADDLGWSDWGTPEAIERTFAALGWRLPWRGPALATA